MRFWYVIFVRFCINTSNINGLASEKQKGLAQIFTSDKCLSNKYCGKEPYKSPEIINKQKTFDAKANDVWCLTICLFIMCVGGPLSNLSLQDCHKKETINWTGHGILHINLIKIIVSPWNILSFQCWLSGKWMVLLRQNGQICLKLYFNPSKAESKFLTLYNISSTSESDTIYKYISIYAYIQTIFRFCFVFFDCISMQPEIKWLKVLIT